MRRSLYGCRHQRREADKRCTNCCLRWYVFGLSRKACYQPEEDKQLLFRNDIERLRTPLRKSWSRNCCRPLPLPGLSGILYRNEGADRFSRQRTTEEKRGAKGFSTR